MWQGLANEFVNIFGKINGSDFRLARKAKRRWGFIGSSFVCCRKVREQQSSEVANGAGKVGQKRWKGIERQRGKGTDCQTQIKLQLVQIYQQTSV